MLLCVLQYIRVGSADQRRHCIGVSDIYMIVFTHHCHNCFVCLFVFYSDNAPAQYRQTVTTDVSYCLLLLYYCCLFVFFFKKIDFFLFFS